MGGKRCWILAAVYHLNLHAGQLAGIFRQLRHHGDLHAGRQRQRRIIGGKLTVVQIIAQANELASLLQRQVGVQRIVFAEKIEQPAGVHGLRRAPFPRLHKGGQLFARAAFQRIVGVAGGPVGGQGQHIVAGDARCGEQRPELLQNFVLPLLVPIVIVHLKGKAQRVARKNIAVRIQDLAPGGRLGIFADDVGVDLLRNLAALHQLQLDQAVGDAAEQQHQQNAHGQNAVGTGTHRVSSVKRRWIRRTASQITAPSGSDKSSSPQNWRRA